MNSILFSQNSNSQISYNQFNKKYLEHLIKVKIDSVRNSHNCKKLVNDSILYFASMYHSKYMANNERLSHFELKEETKTPQLRANFFGAKNYSVGENVLKISFQSDIEIWNKKRISSSTYNGLSDAIVNAWVNSPGHFKNIITPKFQITGVSVQVDSSKNVLYACQKFAKVQYRFRFSENNTLFPYSEYSSDTLRRSFKGVKSNLAIHEHDWGLEHIELEKCNKCEENAQRKPYISLKYERKNFILKIENSDFVKQLIQNKNDGFAIEVVELNDYICDNPEYYSKPSRRNGQCRINGRILKPLYRKELYKGYKKRKPKEDFKFLRYIFGADSVKFFHRFNRYKIEKYDSKYFEIKLGRLPKGIDGYWNYNLVYLQDNQICDIDYFTNYCGEIFSAFQNPEFVFADIEQDYEFDLEKKNITFNMPFEKNIYEIKEEDVSAFHQTLEGFDFTIDSISIQAFSSVEGDSLLNRKLQLNRAESIIDLLKKNQKTIINTSIEVNTDWNHFYSQIQGSEKWRFLLEKDKSELLEVINQFYSDSLEYIFKEERKAIVNILGTFKITDKNLEYYILKEQEKLLNTFSKSEKEHTLNIDNLLKKYQRFYFFVHSKIIENKIDSSILLKLKMPKHYNRNIKLTERFLLNRYQYPTLFKIDNKWVEYEKKLLIGLLENSISWLSPEFIYNYSKISAEELLGEKGLDTDKVELLYTHLKILDKSKEISRELELNINKLIHNLNVAILNRTFKEDDLKYSEESYTCIIQLKRFYEKYESLSDTIILKLAKTAVFFNNINLALELLSPYLDNETTLAYAMQLYYQHNPFDTDNAFYETIIESSKSMDEKIWCNMFMKECGIPFQAFDHEKLRDIFCQNCLDKNEFMIKILE